TVLDLTGTAILETDGRSFASQFEKDDDEERVALGETAYPLRFGWASLRSVRMNGKKLIVAPHPEFYDLAADPKELKNAYTLDDAGVKSLNAMLPAANESAASLPDPKDKIEQQNLLHRALIAAQEKRLDEARQALAQVLKLDPQSLLTLRQLGDVEVQAGN